MRKTKRLGMIIMTLLMTSFALFACETNEQNDNKDKNEVEPLYEGISTYDDGTLTAGCWIWADVKEAEGQWVAFRKTFTLDEKPLEAIARISADTKYWLWINGELAIFEGQLKLGTSLENWYYDEEDILKYLVKGENTIAVQVFYSGKTSSSTVKTGVPGFLFDAKVDNRRIVSDNTWKAILDPAYETPVSLNNDRNGEANIKYNSMFKLVDDYGYYWIENGFDDSDWEDAIIQDELILENDINNHIGPYYEDINDFSGVYPKGFDPRINLISRSIPQVKFDEITKYTANGTNGTKSWTKTTDNSNFLPLNLPDTYTVLAEVSVGEPTAYTSNQPTGAAIGLCVCVSDSNNFYMPQISFNQSNIYEGVRFNPHIKRNGNWNVTSQDLINSEVGKSLYQSGSYDYRYNKKHFIKIEVTPNTISTYLNDYLLGTINDSSLPRNGSTIGIRQDINELVNIYSLKVTDKNGKELYNANINGLQEGAEVSRISLLSKENTLYSGFYNTVAEDNNGDKYISIRNSCAAINDGSSSTKYKIVNETNIQGTPYLKVRSTNGGELISIKSDSWVNQQSGGTSIAHQYITTTGEQEWEALGWMNGYEITFTIPNTVEVLELGFRKSGYNSEATGMVTTDNAVLNQLYQEAFDTLYVCMRDSYMDCPDRERCQWWGDSVVNMQQAAYAFDEQGALLYKKTLEQALGFSKLNGAMVSMVASPRQNLELPMQSLAGVHSFWQYYMYYGDKELMIKAYPTLINYLKLWGISDNGVIVHRSGDWDWFDWGENYDKTVIENCWYYIALEAVLNIANLEGSNASLSEIEFLQNRMTLIKENFDNLYWDNSKNAYYKNTANGKADDRANALAIYAGLAEECRYEGILNVLVNTYNASPYMEKYVLEAMYMINRDEEAIARTLNRFTPFTLDDYPTLSEIWLDQALFGGDETKNHAWTGAPLSLLYMYNAGITSTSPAFKTIQIKPQLGSLNEVNAQVERESGKVLVNVKKTNNGYSLNVTIPQGADYAVVYVPKASINSIIELNGTTIFKNNLSSNLPQGVSYLEEDSNYVAFKVTSGTYSFISK